MTDTTYTTEQIRAMLGSITQGEWVADSGLGDSYIKNAAFITLATSHGSRLFPGVEEQAWHNATFIAAAPAIVRQLLDEIERLKAGS